AKSLCRKYAESWKRQKISTTFPDKASGTALPVLPSPGSGSHSLRMGGADGILGRKGNNMRKLLFIPCSVVTVMVLCSGCAKTGHGTSAISESGHANSSEPGQFAAAEDSRVAPNAKNAFVDQDANRVAPERDAAVANSSTPATNAPLAS